MNHDHVHVQHRDADSAPPFWRSRYAIGLLVFSAVAVYFLLTEHRAHFFGALPFLLLLACPFMHLFMHGGHGGHAGHGGGNQDSDMPTPTPTPTATPTVKTGERP